MVRGKTSKSNDARANKNGNVRELWKNLVEELQGELQSSSLQEENNEMENAETESFSQSM